MRTYDFTPLFRSSIGFDRWSELFDAASRADDSAAGYPPTTSRRWATTSTGS